MKRWLDYGRTIRSRIVLDRGFARALWVVPYLWMKGRMRRGNETVRIAYHPQPAGPWYTLPLALVGTGVRTVRSVAAADVVIVFDDRTTGEATVLPDGKPTINSRITDISKSRVAAVFERVFGYALRVDPLTHRGPMVEKSDENGVHDGRIVQGPLRHPVPGMAYQRLIDSAVGEGVTEDLRCTCVDGEIVSVIRKEKALDARFAARYLATAPLRPGDALSDAERAQLRDFLRAMGLDFGAIDVLRDHGADGRLYVVDVNKTSMPVLAMNTRDLDAVLREVGTAAQAMILKRVNGR